MILNIAMKQYDLAKIFQERATLSGDSTFMVFGNKEMSYAKAYEQALTLSFFMRSHGISKNDRVALWMHNCPEFVVVYFATLMSGATVVPINSMFKRDEAKFIVEDSGAKFLITASDKIDSAENIRSRVDACKKIISFRFDKEAHPEVYDMYKLIGDRTAVAKDNLIVENKPHDLAQIIYTSGTTGTPKGACLSHGNLVSNVLDCKKLLKMSYRDVFICLLPLFHSFSLTVTMLLPMVVGAKIVIFRAITPFKRVLRSVRKHRVTIFVGVPALYNAMKAKRVPWLVKNLLMPIFNPIRACISGSAALAPETISAFEANFKVPLVEGYGLTEASPVVSLNPLDGKRIPGSVGKAVESVQIKVVDKEGNKVEAGEVGELLVKGPNVMQGYWHLHAETAKTVVDGWLYTGDLVKVDEQGYIYIVGRLKDMINVRGFNVYPREIEENLYHLPNIKEAAAVGVHHPKKGEVPVAYVVVDETVEFDTRAIASFLKTKLAAYKQPYKIIRKESLPKNTTGKILKFKLKEEFEAENFKNSPNDL